MHLPEQHRTQRIGRLRAAVMGANDGVVSTASLLVGVATAEVGRSSVLFAGIAGLVAGAMSIAAGEYLSVSTQADTVKYRLEISTIQNFGFVKTIDSLPTFIHMVADSLFFGTHYW